MSRSNIRDIAQRDLFTAEKQLKELYTSDEVAHVLRLREMYSWFISNPDSRDRQFIAQEKDRYGIGTTQAYADLAIVKMLLPLLSSASRDFHRYRANEMLLETYRMAKARKDTKTMERAAASYAKYNRVDLEDEQVLPYDMIVVQPFTATSDPTVLGLKPIPNLQQKIDKLLAKYRAETIDIEDIEYEEVDLEETIYFPSNEETNG
ncbi:MAG: hypothetical protein E7074_06505 [Bacteroidales bacterium]|nr:hypothetical protein [Bacteroidales bacterium]